jgi:tetratricopeptide (TPR) repeat protein
VETPATSDLETADHQDTDQQGADQQGADQQGGNGQGANGRGAESGDEPERRLVDPEQVLAAYRWRFDSGTLRELTDNPDQLRSVRDRLTDKVEYAERDAVRARLLSLRAVVSRVLGDLGRAVADGRAALAHAEATGELRRIAIVKARLAHVLQWRGEFAEADRLYAQADSVELPDRLRAETHELAGRSAFEQGRFMEACTHFETALDLRKGADPEMTTRVEVALDAIMIRVREHGWGPYPRSDQEILGKRRPPRPELDERTGPTCAYGS